MEHNEKEAYKLFTKLIKLKLPARISGGGVHWDVEVGPKEERSLSVACIWYERNIHGLILGMNPFNNRSQLRHKQNPRQGAEFYLVLKSDGKQIADGRTQNRRQVVKCVCSWIAGTPLDDLVQNVPFVNEKRRIMETIASHLDPGLVWEIMGDPSYDLWVYGADGSQRSCRIHDESCSFFYGQAQLAYREYSMDITSDVSAWLLDSVPLRLLAERGIQLERHAEVIENDPSRWHWLHLHDRINDPEDVLAPLAPLISALADSPTASKFYTYSSLNRLCFSASSHYPWVGKLPVVAPIKDNVYDINGTICNLKEAVAKIESALQESPIMPFFGSQPEYDIHILNKIFIQKGSLLRPTLTRRGQWSDVTVSQHSRECILSLHFITCIEGTFSYSAKCANTEDVVCIAMRFIEEKVSFEKIKEVLKKE